MAERSALVVTTPAAAAARTSGATVRADEVVGLLRKCGYAVARTTAAGLRHERQDVDLAVAVSYACARSLFELRRRADRVWLDAVDSWLLVDGSGLRRGRPSYALRAGRDAWHLARMPRPDLVTYISGADLRADRGTIRARRRLVLPGQTCPLPAGPAKSVGRRIVLAGDWNYPPNRHGLKWFLTRVLPELERRQPTDDWTVVVYGAEAGVHSDGRLQVAGYAADASALHRVGDLHAAPIHFGGGVKRKVLFPLLAGLAVVTTPTGAHGLRPHPLLDVRRTASGFAAALAVRLDTPPVFVPVVAKDVLDRDDSMAVETWLRS